MVLLKGGRLVPIISLYPVKVTVSSRGDFPPVAFFTIAAIFCRSHSTLTLKILHSCQLLWDHPANCLTEFIDSTYLARDRT